MRVSPFHRMRLARCAAVVGLLLSAGSASADVLLFNNRAAFDAARGSTAILESFETSFATWASVDFGDFTMTETGGFNSIGNADSSVASALGLSNAITHGSRMAGFDDNDDSQLTFQFAQPVNAFGVDVTASEATTIGISGDVVTSLVRAANTPGFFGVIDTGGSFDTMIFTASGGPTIGFDAVSANLVPVPLPVAGLGGVALMGIVAAKRKRHSGAGA